MLTRLADHFKAFRRTKPWRQHVSGGVAFLEVTINPETKRWHPHYHILCQGEFWNQKDLSEAWKKQTTDSHIVDIQIVKNFDDVTHYVVKYASKGLDPTIWRSEPHLREAIDALQHSKLIVSFGTFRKLRLLAKPHDETAWVPLMPAHELIRQALAGNKESERICLRLWGRRYKLWLERTYRCEDTS